MVEARLYLPHVTKGVAEILKTVMCASILTDLNCKREANSSPHSSSHKGVRQIGNDILGQWKEVQGYRYIVTAVDYISKFVRAKPLKEKTEN